MDKTILITITILVLISLLFLFASVNNKKIDQGKRSKLFKRLEELKSSSNSEDVSVRRDSIIKLDNLLSKSLQYYFNNTLSCGDNLKSASKIFKKDQYNSIWDAHKIRNLIVHDDYDIKKEEAQKIYNVYKMSINKILR